MGAAIGYEGGGAEGADNRLSFIEGDGTGELSGRRRGGCLMRRGEGITADGSGAGVVERVCEREGVQYVQAMAAG